MPVYLRTYRATNRPGRDDNTGRIQPEERVKAGKGRPRGESERNMDEACGVVARYLRLNRGKTAMEIATATGLSRWMVTEVLKDRTLFESSKIRGTNARAWDWRLSWR